MHLYISTIYKINIYINKYLCIYLCVYIDKYKSLSPTKKRDRESDDKFLLRMRYSK